ncbi:hypothetical protein M0R45_036225 [Rubus argutus]|uniref:Uncharacterized protein n=1 Tax=Rubus argutus TaxID=59490 RepID=A0AAW1VVH4_RUBAR
MGRLDRARALAHGGEVATGWVNCLGGLNSGGGDEWGSWLDRLIDDEGLIGDGWRRSSLAVSDEGAEWTGRLIMVR